MKYPREKRQSRSALSRLNADLGPGFLPDLRRIESVQRCKSALSSIFGGYLKNDKNLFSLMNEEYSTGDDLISAINWYWWQYDVDHRTSDADLKNDLQDLVKILKQLVPAINAVPARTKQVVNQMIARPQNSTYLSGFTLDDVSQISAVLIERCGHIVDKNYVRGPSTAVPHTCARLMKLWSKITKKKFTKSNVHLAANRSPTLVKDDIEFKNNGMHFLHVVLQAIDPSVTFSKVLTGVQLVGKKPEI